MEALPPFSSSAIVSLPNKWLEDLLKSLAANGAIGVAIVTLRT